MCVESKNMGFVLFLYGIFIVIIIIFYQCVMDGK